MIEYTTSPTQTEEVGAHLARRLEERGIKRAFIAMRGEMGVGKTAFTAGFAEYFGISGVKSPTYAVMNQHTANSGVKLYHFDMYRIGDEDDLYSIGYDDYVYGGGYIVVEWSENIEYAIPSDAIYVTIERIEEDDSMRKITIE